MSIQDMHRLDGAKFNPLGLARLSVVLGLISGACILFFASITMPINAYFRVAGMISSIGIWAALVWHYLSRFNQMLAYGQQFESIVNAVAECIVVLDRQAHIVVLNDCAAYQFGLEGSKESNIEMGRFVSGPGNDQIKAILNDSLKMADAAFKPQSLQMDAYRPDGTHYPIHITLSRIPHFPGYVVCSFHDITQRIQAQLGMGQARDEAENALVSLAQKERVIQLSLQGAGAGYWHLDFSSGMLTLDNSAMAILGLERHSFSGRYADWAERIHPEDFPWTQGALMDAMADKESTHFIWDYRVLWPDGTLRYLHVTANIERDLEGTPIAAYGLNFDVTEDKTSELALLSAKEEAQIANKAKSSFLAAMSHEIRTPMNGVIGMIDVLDHTPLNSEQEDLIKTIRDSAFGLLTIIDDILDFSKIEAGHLEIEHVPIDLRAVLESVGDTLYSLAEKKNIQLYTYCDPSLPQVYGDPVRLRQILFNLGGNAVKFTGNDSEVAGRVLIRVEAMPEAVSDRVRVAFHIDDNGIGISPETQAKLFRPFSQAESSTTRKYGGTGLGLTICLLLAELMGGKIELHSTEGKGSIFSVLLDLEPVLETQNLSVHDLSGLSIPLLCFDPTVSGFLERYLAHAGATVFPVPDSKALTLKSQALADSQAEQILLVDTMGNHRMGQMLRYSLIEALPGVPLKFVFLERGKRRHPRLEGDDGLTIDLDALHRETFLLSIAAIAGRTSLKALSKKSDKQKFARRETPSIEQAEALGQLILIAEDNATNQKVLLHQLGVLGYAAEVADNGRIALEKWRSGRYGLLLTDCHMPEMDGYELAHAIRVEETDSPRHMPIVAITADALKGTNKLCLEAGMDDYLTKPMQLELLREIILKWVPEPNPTAQAESDQDTVNLPLEASVAAEASLTSTADTTKINPVEGVVDIQSLIEVLGMDDPAMLADFYMDFLRSGEETAVEIEQSHQALEIDTLGRLAHRLKSSARTVGAHALADCCTELEQAGKQGDKAIIELQMQAFPILFSQVRTWINHYTQSITT